jgi:hypothetical protein
MMRVPYADLRNFEEWIMQRTVEDLNVLEHFPLSRKIYQHEDYTGAEAGDICSFTIIVPGAGPGKDPYWTIMDASVSSIVSSSVWLCVRVRVRVRVRDRFWVLG